MSSPSNSNEPLMPHVSFETKARKSEAQIKARAHASMKLSRMTELDTTPALPERPHRDSQTAFATPEQTIIVYDWDDTLFPTNWVRHERKLHWRYKLEDQTQKYTAEQLAQMQKWLSRLEHLVIILLERSMKLGHVVIVTLARPPWVQLSCKNFFPRVGKFLTQHDIKVVYAQDLESASKSPSASAQRYDKEKFSSNEDAQKYWIQKKQHAIMGEIAKFYAAQGTSWKNIISVGDSDFERYAMQASLKDYATMDDDSPALVGAASSKLPLLSPSTSRSQVPDQHAMSGWVGRHYRRVRCKTVKMFDSPTLEDLISEISLMIKWVPSLVSRDAGLDVDLEVEDQVVAVYHELTGGAAY